MIPAILPPVCRLWFAGNRCGTGSLQGLQGLQGPFGVENFLANFFRRKGAGETNRTPFLLFLYLCM
jgi:hypothetical protein